MYILAVVVVFIFYVGGGVFSEWGGKKIGDFPEGGGGLYKSVKKSS